MSDKTHCSKCGSDAEPLVILRGSTGMQIFLWCMLVVPGFFYSLWREASKKVVCSVCGSTQVSTVPTVEKTDHDGTPTLADEHPAVEEGHLYSTEVKK